MKYTKDDFPALNGRPRNVHSQRYVTVRSEQTVLVRINPSRLSALDKMADHYETSKQALIMLAIDKLRAEFQKNGGLDHE